MMTLATTTTFFAANTEVRPDSPNEYLDGKKDISSALNSFLPQSSLRVLPPIGDLPLGPSYGTRSRRNSLPTLSGNMLNFPQITEGPSVSLNGQVVPSDSCPSSPCASPRSPVSSRRGSMDDTEFSDMTSSPQRKRYVDEDYVDESIEAEDPKPKRRRRNSTLESTEENVFSAPPKKKTYKKKKKTRFECEGIDKCKLCQHGTPYYLHKSMNPGWRETVLAVFDFFPKRITVNEWRKMHEGQDEVPEIRDENLTEEEKEIQWLFFPDAYGFLEHHWDHLCPPQHKSRNFAGTHWRKTIQDTLSHNRTFFLSGKEIFGKTGFWRLIARPQPNVPNGVVVPSSNLGDTTQVAPPATVVPFQLPKTEFTISSVLKVDETRIVKPTPVPCKVEEHSLNAFDLLLAAAEEMESAYFAH